MLRRRLNSFRYAAAGLIWLFRSQPNAVIHLAFVIAVVAAGFFFCISPAEWCITVLAITVVLAAEAFNTAVEHVTDLASPRLNPLAGKAKDVAAAAVLIAAIGAATVGLIIFLPKIFSLFRHSFLSLSF